MYCLALFFFSCWIQSAELPVFVGRESGADVEGREQACCEDGEPLAALEDAFQHGLVCGVCWLVLGWGNGQGMGRGGQGAVAGERSKVEVEV